MSVFLLFFSLLFHNPKYCSCGVLGPIDDKQYNEYSLIVKGKVTNVAVKDFKRTIYLVVETYYKGGERQPKIKIVTPRQEGECGIIPKVGESWLMFAYANGKSYETDLCTRTKNMNPKAWDYRKDNIEDDIKFLEARSLTDSR